MKRNKEYEHGYRQGYEWYKYECSSLNAISQNIRQRGISLRSQYAVAFRHGATDASKNIQCKY